MTTSGSLDAFSASPEFQSLAADATLEAAHRLVDLAVEYLATAGAGEGAVSRGTPPMQLAERFDTALPWNGVPLDAVAQRLRDDVMAEANRLTHPMYAGHQVSPPLPVAIWTEAVISALNNSQAVREMSPAGTMVERQVIRWMCTLAGFGAAGGGTFTSGGTEATLTALLAARGRALPHAWEEGVGGDPPVVLCGAHAHYAVSRAVGIMGFGVRQAIIVPSDGYRMDARQVAPMLARLRDEGRRVLAVVATAGSTATGAFDDLATIADACESHGTWLHVDAAHGGSALFSARHGDRLRGIARVDSLAWDPHKMMLMPLAAGMVLVRDAAVLDRAFAQSAPYLFHQTQGAPVLDLGPRSLQCSRRGDVLKVWASILRYGQSGIAAFYDYLCDLTAEFHRMVAAHPRFEALHLPETNILCFRFTGGLEGGVEASRLDECNRELRERYNASGAGWITATLLNGRRVLRVTIINPRTTREHLARMLEGLDAIGTSLIAQSRPTAPS
ncbi:MAG: pyridoxal-dependent decarboxylase [Gemmatimonadaceae bacterium]